MKIKLAEQLAKELMNKYNLTNWSFKFDRALRRRGLCNSRTRTISLSKPLTKRIDIDNVKDTILHEIAHALVGANNGHNRIWKAKAISIGCSGKRTTTDKVVIKPKYIYVCPNCHRQFIIYRRLKDSSCLDCCKKYNNNKYTAKFKLELLKEKKQ